MAAFFYTLLHLFYPPVKVLYYITTYISIYYNSILKDFYTFTLCQGTRVKGNNSPFASNKVKLILTG